MLAQTTIPLYVLMILLITVAKGNPSQPLALDMAPNSVDDAYSGCTKEMLELVKTKYLPNEINENNNFAKAWKQASKVNKHKDPGHGLTEDHAIAIRVYVDGGYQIYKELNAAVREGKSTYTSTFNYHALHFLLTDVLNILKKEQKDCMTTFRGTKMNFAKDVVNKEIRFGMFTSTTLNVKKAHDFGTTSCFKITTCYGAELGKFSHLPKEEEVLIPPFEKFKVLAVQQENNQPCEVIYVLKSNDKISNLNCALMPLKL